MDDTQQPAAVAAIGAPVTAADETLPAAAQPKPALRLDPTRYGDWELNGKCVDF